MDTTETICGHLDQIAVTTTRKHHCDDCVRISGTWLHLRMCLSCGHVGCCDSSPNRHAARHYRRTTHPLVRSIEPGEHWIWCYADQVMPGQLPV
jgi:uncharacterized UBP type Zn finger protein